MNWALALTLVLGASLVAPSGASSTPAIVRRSVDQIELSNGLVTLGFQRGEGRWQWARLENKLARRTLSIQSDDFALGVEGRKSLTAADFVLQEVRDERTGGAQRLVFRLANGPLALQLDAVYELRDADFFVRRRLELKASRPLELRQVAVIRVKLEGTAAHQGYGEPVFLEDTFWGLEFPGGTDKFADGMLTLTHHPGRTITDRFTSKTAVIGVAESGRVADRFLQYVATFQVTPRDLGLFVNYNTWWTLMPPTEQNCLELIELFRQKLFLPHGQSIDTFTIDEGWDNKENLWGIREDRFPRGFTPLLPALRSINAKLGLWLSPSSGYRHSPWGISAGYEGNSDTRFLCQSGPKYRRDITQVVTDLARRYDLAFFKFDGFCARCEAAGHGHLPGDYAREANVDAFIDLLAAARRTRPGVYLDPTCGMWLSPWWLRYADSLWGSVSGDYPSIIVPAPALRDSATTTRDGVFRRRCQEHPGYPPAAIEHLGIIVITPEKWEDNAMIVLGRGARLLTLYFNPKFFQKGDEDWAFLGSILKWARHHASTLQNTRLILGDPLKREPYGYVHFRGDRGVIALRNPFIEARTVELALSESLGWRREEAGPADRDFYAQIVYPRCETLPSLARYGDTLRLPLGPYETLILQVQPRQRSTIQLLGVRNRLVRRTGDALEYAVYVLPGERPTPFVFSGSPVTRGIATIPSVRRDSPRPKVIEPQPATSTGPSAAVERWRLRPESPASGWRALGECEVTVLNEAKATMHVLCDLGQPAAATVACSAQVNGRPAEVRTVRQPEKQHDVSQDGRWTWFEFDVPAGSSVVSLVIEDPKRATHFARGQVGWWLIAERHLEQTVLRGSVGRAGGPIPDEPLPLPILNDTYREVCTVRPLSPFRAGSQWAATDQGAVRLDEVEPEESRQDWGKPMRNRSVWNKPMTIAGRTFTLGLGTHANGNLVYELEGGRFLSFRCFVGRDEHAGDGRIEFEVWLDGRRQFASGPMTRRSPAKPVEVDLKGAARLELRTLDGGDGISGDHGDWADAQLVR